jgi:glycosyltransferase involved in cell wall biosynthesis
MYNPDIVITFDSDGQHNPADIPKLIKPILNDSADIVLGSRFLNDDTKVPFVRKLILKAGVLFTNTTSKIKLTDTHNGFRALGRKAINSIKITHRGMEHASDIINEITKNKLRYQEAPVKIIYTDYSINKGQASIGFIKMGIKIILHKILN